jgi:hypothetical protein
MPMLVITVVTFVLTEKAPAEVKGNTRCSHRVDYVFAREVSMLYPCGM